MCKKNKLSSTQIKFKLWAHNEYMQAPHCIRHMHTHTCICTCIRTHIHYTAHNESSSHRRFVPILEVDEIQKLRPHANAQNIRTKHTHKCTWLPISALTHHHAHHTRHTRHTHNARAMHIATYLWIEWPPPPYSNFRAFENWWNSKTPPQTHSSYSA